jgi:hypothetical protein
MVSEATGRQEATALEAADYVATHTGGRAKQLATLPLTQKGDIMGSKSRHGVREYRVIFLPISVQLEERVKEFLDATPGPGKWTRIELAMELTLASSFLLCEGREPEFSRWYRRKRWRELDGAVEGVVLA